jgi:23S rRNA pseudouridine2605 synthase
MTEPQDQMRLQRYLSLAGHCSRRKAEELITQGRVSVNGRVVNTLGAKVDPSRARVKVDDKPVKLLAERIYILLHKPSGYITSLDDPADRPIVTDLLPKGMPRVYPAGRLDWDSEGALFLTNDGDLAHAVTHPSRKVTRVYEVKLKGEIDDEGPIMKRLREGVDLDDGFMKPDRVSMLRFTGRHTWLVFYIHEGRNRILRRYCEAVGHPVLKLRRTMIGPIDLSTLPIGAFRNLTSREIFDLYEAVGLNPMERPPEAGRADLEPVQLYEPLIRGERPARFESAESARADRPAPRFDRSDRPGSDRPRADRPGTDRPRADRPGTDRPRADRPGTDRPRADRPGSDRPRADRPGSDRPRADRPGSDRPRADRPGSDRPRADRPGTDRPRADRPGSDRPRADRPGSDRPGSDRPRADRPGSDRPRADRPGSDRPRTDRPGSDRPGSDRPRTDRPGSDRPRADRPSSDRPSSDRPRTDRPSSSERPRPGKPPSSRPSSGGKPSSGSKGAPPKSPKPRR